MTDPVGANLYDEIAYPSAPMPQTHPDRLAVLASFYGLQPAPVERCRILELGCGDGSNLIPMALGLPAAELLGIDLAAGLIRGPRPVGARTGSRAGGRSASQASRARVDLAEHDHFSPACGSSRSALSAGVRVSAQKVDSATEAAMVSANWR